MTERSSRSTRRVTDDVQIAPTEYVVLKKLLYYKMGESAHHLRDIARMIDTGGVGADDSSFSQWVTKLDLDSEYAKAKAFDRSPRGLDDGQQSVCDGL